MDRGEESPSETLGFVLQFLHSQGLYNAEESLIRELENRYPEGSSAGGSPTAPQYSGESGLSQLDTTLGDASRNGPSFSHVPPSGDQGDNRCV